MNRRPTWLLPTAASAVALVYAVLPGLISDYGLSVLNLAGIAAIGALGLNLLTGYTGQLSLGHAAFLGAGAYTCGALGDLSFPVAVAAAAVVGALLGLAVSPIAVRLKGHTVAIATLALVFVGQHVFRNWTSVTGGNAGRSDLPSPSDVLPGTHDQGWFWLVWALVALTVWGVANVARSRPGRAMVAVRSDEQAAAVAGIDVTRTKVMAFVASGALAAVAGALYGSYKQHVGPEDWGLLVSIQYLAMVLLGGMGTVAGPVVGAVFVTALPRVVEELVHTGPTSTVTDAQVTQILFGLLIVAFVLVRAARTDFSADVTAGLRRRSTTR
ncbi:MAG TPA: branched-chain amino acid ABC transporter permease [Actinomycetes bacterium]|nr:branched-chain amino acid ABC transporter permease [Actinomycetes bacterium]